MTVEDWFGDLPSGWTSAPLGYLVRTTGGGTPSTDEPLFWGGPIQWVSPKDMKTPLIESSMDTITEHAIAGSAVRLVESPSVLVVVRGMILAHSFPVGLGVVPLTVNQDMKAFRPRAPELRAEWLAYALRAAADTVLALVEESGHGTKKLRTDLLRRLHVPLPPLQQQQMAIEFLDQRTSILDELVSPAPGKRGPPETLLERERDLFDEFRNALISGVVCGRIPVEA